VPRNFALRINTLGHDLVSRNRKVSRRPWKWGRTGLTALVVAVLGAMLASLILSYADLQYLTVNSQISQAYEDQKYQQDLNRKLRIELSNLKSISILEKLAVETYGMKPPQPSQVIYLP
jgi:cell division protein FtsL